MKPQDAFQQFMLSASSGLYLKTMRERLEHFLFLDGRVPWLDGLRAVAVLLVIARHVFDRPFFRIYGLGHNFTGAQTFLLSVPSIGWTGVHLFFLISGFLVGGTVAIESSRGGFKLPFFLCKRFIRVFVPAIIFLLLYRIYESGDWNFLSREAIENLLFISSYTGNIWLPHFWSLDVEAHFYIAVGVLGFFLQRLVIWRSVDRKHLGFALLLAAFVFAVARIVGAICTGTNDYYAFYVLSYWQVDFFLAGIGLRLIYENRGGTQPNPIARYVWLPIGILLLTAAMVVVNTNNNLFLNEQAPVRLTVFLLLILGVMICFFLASWTEAVARVVEYLPLRVIGALSFSIYLIHLPIIEAVAERPHLLHLLHGFGAIATYVILFLTLTTVSLVAAAAFYLAVERPAMIARRSLFAVRKSRGVVATVAKDRISQS